MNRSSSNTQKADKSLPESWYLLLKIPTKIHGGVVASVSTILIAGCTQGQPSISAVQELPPIILDTYRYESKTLQFYDLSLNGRVVKHVDRLEVSLDDGASWIGLGNNGASSLNINLASCSENCDFNYSLPDVGSQWPVLMELPVEGEKQALLRGQSLFGVTQPTPFIIKRLKSGFFSIGSLGVNELGGQAKTLPSGLSVKSGRLEATAGLGVIR